MSNCIIAKVWRKTKQSDKDYKRQTLVLYPTLRIMRLVPDESYVHFFEWRLLD